MFHPLQQDLSGLKDLELETKIQDLTQKYFTAHKLGNHQLLTQISTFITIYKDELSKRNYQRSKNELDKDLDQLINVN